MNNSIWCIELLEAIIIFMMLSKQSIEVNIANDDFGIIVISGSIGYLCYILSALLTRHKLSRKCLQVLLIRGIPANLSRKYSNNIILEIYNSMKEELLFRGVIQYGIYIITRDCIVTIAISALVFSIVHLWKCKFFVQLVDILLFSFIITIIFQYTFSLLSCFIIHIVRNFCIINQEWIYHKDSFISNSIEHNNDN